MADNVTNNKIITTVELDTSMAAQEIVKLNSLASDSTQDLSKRLDAKNKQIEIQNKLNKKNISTLEKEVKSLKGVEGAEKDLIKAQKKLEKAKLNEVKVTERNAKTQRKLATAYGQSKGAMNKLDNATGGMITRFKLLAANPIVLFFTILVGALTLLKEAFTSSEEGQNRWAKALAVLDAVLGNLLDIVANLAEGLVDMFSNPMEALSNFGTLIKENIINRFEGLMELIPQLGKAIGLLFDGKFSEAGEVAANAVAKVTLGVEDVVGKVKKATEAVKGFIKEQVKEGNAAARVADMRAKADKIERALIVRRSVLESKIAEARLKAKKEDEFTAAERKVFLLEAQKLEDELIDKETAYLELRRDAQILENTFSRTNKENLTKEAEARAAVNLQNAKRAKRAKKIQTELNTVTKEAAAFDKKIAKEVSDFKKALEVEEEESGLDKAERERAQRLLDLEELTLTETEKTQLKLDIEAKYNEDLRVLKSEEAIVNAEAQNELDQLEIDRKRANGEKTLELELELLERKRLQDVEQEGLTAKQIEVINTKASDAKQKLKKKENKYLFKSDEEAMKAGVDMAADAFGISQEVAVARMIMNAPEAVSNIWSQAAKQPTLPQVALHGAVGTAMVIAPIAKGLIDIKKTRFPGKKTRPSRGGGNISVPTAPTGVGSSNIEDLSAQNASRTGVDVAISDNATASALRNSTARGAGQTVAFYEGAYQDFRDSVGFREGHSTIGG